MDHVNAYQGDNTGNLPLHHVNINGSTAPPRSYLLIFLIFFVPPSPVFCTHRYVPAISPDQLDSPSNPTRPLFSSVEHFLFSLIQPQKHTLKCTLLIKSCSSHFTRADSNNTSIILSGGSTFPSPVHRVMFASACFNIQTFALQDPRSKSTSYFRCRPR